MATPVRRAWSTFTIKASAAAAGKRTFDGIASTPSTDRMGDVIEPKGAKFKLPIPLLYQHDSTRPIGHITEAKVTPSGISVKGYVEQLDGPPTLKERLDVAWAEMNSGLVKGLSIGFNPLAMEPVDPKQPYAGQRFTDWEWLELSAVTIPANADASINAIKSIDDRIRMAAPGRLARSAAPPPGASGTSKPLSSGFFSPPGKGTNMLSIEQQLSGLRESRQTKAARIQELDTTRETRGETAAFTDEERTELRGLSGDVQNLDDQISVKQVQLTDSRTARPVDASIVARGTGGAPFGFVRRADPDDKFKGQAHTRRVIAKALAYLSAREGNYVRPSEIAEMRWGKTNPQLVSVMKANEVPGAGSGSGEVWAELVQMDGRFTGDFIEFLYSRTVYDQLPLREVPANIIIKGQDGAATGYFVGESKAIAASAASGSATTLTPLKVAAISVVSNELLQDATPSAEMLIRDSLVQASSQKIDSVFLSTTATSAGVSPAGILHGLVAGGSAGNTVEHVMQDLQALLANFITGKYASDLYIIMTPTLSAGIGFMRNSLGLPAFAQTLTLKGGTFQGYTVVTGHNVSSGNVIMLSPSDVWKIGDMGVQISVSQEAMIEQNSSPAGATDTPSAATNTLTSMFQEESTAIKVVRRINWQVRRADAVTYIGDASYNLGS